MMRRSVIIGVLALLGWLAISGFWYSCRIQRLCGKGEAAELAAADAMGQKGPERETASDSDPVRLQAELVDMDTVVPDLVEQPEPENGVAPETSPVKVAPAPGDAPEEFPEGLQGIQRIQFSFAKPLMTDREDIRNYIQMAARYLKDHPQARIHIAGYTDDTAARESNMRLSEDRAQVVANLFREAGVAENRMVIEAKGEANPIATNDTREGRALNRRVEIEIHP